MGLRGKVWEREGETPNPKCQAPNPKQIQNTKDKGPKGAAIHGSILGISAFVFL
jgi:hypothetical protein